MSTTNDSAVQVFRSYVRAAASGQDAGFATR